MNTWTRSRIGIPLCITAEVVDHADVQGVEDFKIGLREIVRAVGSINLSPEGGSTRFRTVTAQVSKVFHTHKGQPARTNLRRRIDRLLHSPKSSPEA